MPHALIVEDDSDAAGIMAAFLATEGFSAATAHTLRDARKQLVLHSPDLVLLDLNLPDGNGMSLVSERELLGDSSVVLMTGQASVESSIQAFRMGAMDYLVKPVSTRHLQSLLGRLMLPAAAPGASPGLAHLVGHSAPMLRLYEQLACVADTSISVFIEGESGTGKELVARSVHDLSRRRNAPFLALNCGAISPQLIESEIFGHEKGSFTGADKAHAGFFEQAAGGTLFLDEVTEMPPSLQVKLLRVLESGTFMRVGSTKLQETDVRIVAATNRDAGGAVASGQLRQDLYYRLSVFPIAVPPLRERLEDIPLLANHFLAQTARREGRNKQITQQALDRLAQYDWPGNVRELRNVLQRAYVLHREGPITERWLPDPAAVPAPGGRIGFDVGTPLHVVERETILATLAHFGGHRERTAAELGISIKTLYNRLREYER